MPAPPPRPRRQGVRRRPPPPGLALVIAGPRARPQRARVDRQTEVTSDCDCELTYSVVYYFTMHEPMGYESEICEYSCEMLSDLF